MEREETMSHTEPMFFVYSKDGCPYCTKIQQVLELAKLQNMIYKLNADFTKEEFYERFGEGSTFPQVVFKDTHIGGCIESVKFLREMKLV